MKALFAFLIALGGFFMLLNSLGGIVGGIWLAVLGEWGVIGMGLILVVVSPFILGIALLPQLALGAAMYAARRSRIGILFFGFLLTLYLATLLTAWCVGVLLLFMSLANEQSWIPLLIWSYGAATGPWAYMAGQGARGEGGDAALLAIMFAQVAYLVMVVTGILAGASLIGMAKTFGGIMLLYVVLQMFVAFLSLDEMQRDAQ